MLTVNNLNGFNSTSFRKPYFEFITSNFDSSVTSIKTWSSISFGKQDPTRKILIGITARDDVSTDISSVTIGGVTATELNKFRNTNGGYLSVAAFYIAEVPTGENGDIVINYTGTSFFHGITIWSLYNLNIKIPVFSQSFDVSSQDTSPGDIYFRNDGLKMYITGTSSGGDVHEYNLSTAWDILSASFNQSFDVSSQDSSAQGIFFKDDGTKMYINGPVNNRVYEYNLSTAWDISSATFSQSVSISRSIGGLFFSDDGLKMFYIYTFSLTYIAEYNLSTAWDISTATFNTTLLTGASKGLFFNDDGTKMYFVHSTNEIREYNLSTAWNISSASFNQSFDVSSQDSSAQGIFFKDNGTKMYVVGDNNDNIYEYNLNRFGYAEQINSGSGSTTIDLSLDTEPGDWLFGVVYSQITTGITWTGLNEDSQPSNFHSGASLVADLTETPRTITASMGSSSYNAGASIRIIP